MTEWFQERYIARGEHQEIVEYYRKLVGQLHRTVKDLRAELDARRLDDLVEHSRRLAERETRRIANASLAACGDNVIVLESRRRASRKN